MESDVLKIVSSVKLLGVHLDDQLNFNLHISNICKSAFKQLNALVRLKCFLGTSTAIKQQQPQRDFVRCGNQC